VIGSGGREHALVWKLAQSPRVTKIFAAPGNAGMASLAEPIPLKADQVVDLANFAVDSKVDLTVVGPELPLVKGIVDHFRQKGLAVFGPTSAAAQLEGSKVFSKEKMLKYGVPTAAAKIFSRYDLAVDYLKTVPAPVVVKADGLAAGKGVIVAATREEALRAVESIMQNRVFGEAGASVVIEECLQGEEVSVLAVVDGVHCALLQSSQDHKRAFDNDEGPNTGGMGAYSPVPAVSDALMRQIRAAVFEPMIAGMNRDATPFTGILYAGIMLTAQGPKVLEFNVRFGDPEAQALLPRLKTDLVEIILAAVDGEIGRIAIEWDPRPSACVVLASKGYPGTYEMGRPIQGLEQAAESADACVFHAGTSREGGKYFTSGGRVLNVVGLGKTLEAAIEKAYETAEKIQFKGKQFRRDIGARALKKITQ
jgi:phosphoribosylamine--glycine ligase